MTCCNGCLFISNKENLVLLNLHEVQGASDFRKVILIGVP